jgi:hypothetical protein
MTTMSKDRYIKPAAFQAQRRKQHQLGKPTSTLNYTLPILMWLMTKDWSKGMEGEPAEVAADEGVVERDGVEPAEVAADSDGSTAVFATVRVALATHLGAVPLACYSTEAEESRPMEGGRRAGGASDGDVQEGIGLGVSSSCYQPVSRPPSRRGVIARIACSSALLCILR